jgi:hypothetical protein
MNKASFPRRSILPASLLVLSVLALGACTGSGASPAASVTVGPPSSSPVLSPSSAPSAQPGASGATVTSAEAAFAAVQARSPWFDGVKQKDPSLIGQASWWRATPSTDGAWTVTVDIGWGDCQAGCIDHHVWVWQVASDGLVTLQSETGSALSADQGAALAGTSSVSGIGGEITAGPTCPVERPGDSACGPRPVTGAVLVVKDGSGQEVARFTTDASGLFRIDLAPGTYTMAAQPVAGILGTPGPQQVTVSDGKLTTATLGYDTGIR